MNANISTDKSQAHGKLTEEPSDSKHGLDRI